MPSPPQRHAAGCQGTCTKANRFVGEGLVFAARDGPGRMLCITCRGRSGSAMALAAANFHHAGQQRRPWSTGTSNLQRLQHQPLDKRTARLLLRRRALAVEHRFSHFVAVQQEGAHGGFFGAKAQGAKNLGVVRNAR